MPLEIICVGAHDVCLVLLLGPMWVVRLHVGAIVLCRFVFRGLFIMGTLDSLGFAGVVIVACSDRDWVSLVNVKGWGGRPKLYLGGPWRVPMVTHCLQCLC